MVSRQILQWNNARRAFETSINVSFSLRTEYLSKVIHTKDCIDPSILLINLCMAFGDVE